MRRLNRFGMSFVLRCDKIQNLLKNETKLERSKALKRKKCWVKLNFNIKFNINQKKMKEIKKV